MKYWAINNTWFYWIFLTILPILNSGCSDSDPKGNIDDLFSNAVLGDSSSNLDPSNIYNIYIGDDDGTVPVLRGEKVAEPIIISPPQRESSTFDVRIVKGDPNLHVVYLNDQWSLEYDATEVSSAGNIDYELTITSDNFKGNLTYEGRIEVLEPVIIAQGSVYPEGGKIVDSSGIIGVEIPAGQLEMELPLSIVSGEASNREVLYAVKFGRELTDKENTMLEARFFALNPLFLLAPAPTKRSMKRARNESEDNSLCGSEMPHALMATPGFYVTSGLFKKNRIDPFNLQFSKPIKLTLHPVATVLCSFFREPHIQRDQFYSPAREPILFINGYSIQGTLGGGNETWGDFPPLARDLNIEGRRFIPFEFRWKTNARFEDVAEDLASAISYISTNTGKKVHIVAHSFGGVLIRTLLEKIDGINSDVTGMVQDVLTLGSPHSGIFKKETERFGFTFPAGRDNDEVGGFLISGCLQLSCYQAGKNIPFTNSDKKDILRLKPAPGHIIAQIQTHEWPEEIPAYVGTSIIDTGPLEFGQAFLGDGLISYEGQLFDIQGTENNSPPHENTIKLRDIGSDGKSYLHAPFVAHSYHRRFEAYIDSAKDECPSAARCNHGSFAILKEMLEKSLEKDAWIDYYSIRNQVPEGLSADIFNGKAHLSWGRVSFAESYVVYISDNPDIPTERDVYVIHTKDTNVLINLDLYPSDTLYFKVVAENPYGKSKASLVSQILRDRSVISGFVSDALTGSPIIGATIRLEIPGKSIETTTNQNGYYVVKMPGNFNYSLILVSKDKYIPESIELSSKTINTQEYIRRDVALIKEGFSTVKVIKGDRLYHLGDDRYGGTVNSQFQLKSMGTAVSLLFHLSQDQIDRFNKISLNMKVKGAQYENRIYVNGHYIWYMGENMSPSDGSYGSYYWTHKLDRSVFSEGTNKLTIESVWGTHDYDDFEFTGIYFTLGD